MSSKVWIKPLTMDEASVLSLPWSSIVALRQRIPFHQDSKCQDLRSNRRFQRTPSTFPSDSTTRRPADVFSKCIIVPQHLQCAVQEAKQPAVKLLMTMSQAWRLSYSCLESTSEPYHPWNTQWPFAQSCPLRILRGVVLDHLGR